MTRRRACGAGARVVWYTTMSLRPASPTAGPGVKKRAVQVLLSNDDYLFLLEDAGDKPHSAYFRELLHREKESRMSSKIDVSTHIPDPQALVRRISEEADRVVQARAEARQDPTRCVATPYGCGGPVTEFRDDLSRREHAISRLCQSCQDKIFKTDDDKLRMVEEEEGELEDTVPDHDSSTLDVAVPTEVDRD